MKVDHLSIPALCIPAERIFPALEAGNRLTWEAHEADNTLANKDEGWEVSKP